MTRSTLSAVCGAMLLTMIGAAACAPATATLRIDPSSVPAASRLAEVHLTPGSGAIVRLVSGETIRGTLKDLRPDRLELLVKTSDNDSRARTIPEGEIQTIARIVGLSKGARTRIGAAIGAAVTVPFGISMVGDMIVPGAIAGAVIGRATGDLRGRSSTRARRSVRDFNGSRILPADRLRQGYGVSRRSASRRRKPEAGSHNTSSVASAFREAEGCGCRRPYSSDFARFASCSGNPHGSRSIMRRDPSGSSD